MKTALITGASGQDGFYLAELLRERGYRLVLNSRRPIDYARPEDLVFCRSILDFDRWLREISIPVDEIYHLACLQRVSESFIKPVDYMMTNAVSMAMLLEYTSPEIKIFYPSSSECLAPDQVPPPEHFQWYQGGASPYAASKLAGQILCQSAREQGRFAVTAVCFNHESPRRGDEFITQKLVKGILNYVETGQAVIIDSLDTMRDWHHAADTAKGMYLAMQRHNADDYIFASGEAHSVREIAEIVCDFFDVEMEKAVLVRAGIDRRGASPTHRIGNPAKAERELGWRRRFTFRETILDMCKGATNAH